MDELKRLDEIIQLTMNSIRLGREEIQDISHFAKDECTLLQDEFIRLKGEASSVIERVDYLEIELKKSKVDLAQVSRQLDNFDENKLKEIYNQTDLIRMQLIVEKEREIQILKRRNDLELHLKSVIKIYERADKLSKDFGVATGILTGDYKKITEQMDDVQNKIILGIKVLEAQETERNRIARDIHDGPAQKLSGLMIKTEVCIKLLDIDIDKTRSEMKQLKELIRETIEETRSLIYNLYPMSLEDLGLIPSLQRLIDEAKTQQLSDIVFTYDKRQELKLNSSIISTLYRITQEAINNIKKHSQATKVEISLNKNPNDIVLKIKDNGIGFKQDQVRINLADNRGFGLSMMKERALLMMGDFSLTSEPSKGTYIVVILPTDIDGEE